MKVAGHKKRHQARRAVPLGMALGGLTLKLPKPIPMPSVNVPVFND